MPKPIDQIKSDIQRIYVESSKIIKNSAEMELKRKKSGEENYVGQSVRSNYQNWYTKTIPIVVKIIPDRLFEFTQLYKDEKRKSVNVYTYGIYDFIMGYSAPLTYDSVSSKRTPEFHCFEIFYTKLEQQLSIFKSALERVESVAADMEGIIQASLFDNEIQAAEELLGKGHLRAAGTLAGVTLEAHLHKVCTTHNLKSRKKHVSIAEFNEMLKNSGVIDVPNWRLIQRLADIRNLSVHAKERDPSSDEIQDLISGTKKIVSTTF